MARNKKRTRRKASQPTPIVTYTVTIAHEPGSECDACAQPRPTLIEQEDGAWVCEACLGLVGSGMLYRAAVINGIYSWGDGI